jgi:hypothetical protein
MADTASATANEHHEGRMVMHEYRDGCNDHGGTVIAIARLNRPALGEWRCRHAWRSAVRDAPDLSVTAGADDRCAPDRARSLGEYVTAIGRRRRRSQLAFGLRSR